MQQHLGRLDGVAKVEVSLVDSKAVLYLKEDAKADLAQVWKATYDSGVTVAEITIIASGHFGRDAAKGLVFEVTPNQSFVVESNQLSQELADRTGRMTLVGRLYKKPEGKQKKSKEIPPMRFEILSVKK